MTEPHRPKLCRGLAAVHDANAAAGFPGETRDAIEREKQAARRTAAQALVETWRARGWLKPNRAAGVRMAMTLDIERLLERAEDA